MAEEVFALSPIAARPNVPGEADYDAIREAFMETARGRWFLNEYAKRNRHTDTGMVLEAVTRLEASLAAQKQPPTLSLLESLGAIRSAVRNAKATAIESMPRPESDEALTAARNGARIVREIAWTLRECGADIRICDLLDTQVKAIEAAQQAATDHGREAVLASYDMLMQRIEQLVDSSAAASAKTEAPAATDNAPPAAAEAREASVTPLFKAIAIEPEAETATALVAEATPTLAPTESFEAIAETAATLDAFPVEIPAAMPEVHSDSPEEKLSAAAAEAAIIEAEAEAHDLAVLEIIAIEMAVEDFSEPETADVEMAPPAVVESHAADLITLQQIAEIALAPVVPEPPASLGAALIASGIIAHPGAPASDPLAPIRRMSQAEKIAFFS
ncbi:hypothetical protein [Tardiphaga sp.]|uniref:hypothetical protein n=1 Tax=Tardiphaga sp. TaxID=1926292 RepID=UPI0025F49E0C|nr:hypothetical protein [Tardiphaga sp.]